MVFASKHPGALTAHFLAAIYTRLTKGRLTESKQLRDVSLTAWASSMTGLSEMRDLREVKNLATAMEYINAGELSMAMDVLTQRIAAIQAAKEKGGTWEAATKLELVPSAGTVLAPRGMRALGK